MPVSFDLERPRRRGHRREPRHRRGDRAGLCRARRAGRRLEPQGSRPARQWPRSIDAAGGEARAIACHIGDMEALDATCSRASRREFGRLDVLVNNAATNPYYGHVLDTDLGAFQKTVDVNIRGYFFASVLGGRLMRESGGGSIINVASVNAIRPGPLQGIYSITKGAVLNLTKVFARECGPDGIRVQRDPARARSARSSRARCSSDAAQVEHYLGADIRSVASVSRATSQAPRCSSPRTPPST